MDSINITGILASVFTAVALVPQLVKIINEKKPGGISYLMLVSLFIGLSFWIAYGCMKNDWIIIISNAFSLLVNLLIGILSFIYSRR